MFGTGMYRNPNQISRVSNALLNLFFILGSFVCIAPIILVILVSVTDEMEILKTGYTFFPKAFSFKAYEYIAASGKAIWRAYGVSLFTTVFGTMLSLLITCMYAYPLARNGFRYKTFFSFIAYFTMIFGGGLIPWYMVYTHIFKIKDSIWIMIFPYLLNAWFALIMRTFYKTTIHESILESAKIDGAGEFRIFFTIVLPLCRAGLATIGLFCTLNYWNDWYLPLIFVNNPKMYNIQYLMYQYLLSIQFLSSSSSFSQSSLAFKDLPSESARMAVAVLSIGPIIFAYPFFQKYFVKGLTIGAVKG